MEEGVRTSFLIIDDEHPATQKHKNSIRVKLSFIFNFHIFIVAPLGIPLKKYNKNN